MSDWSPLVSVIVPTFNRMPWLQSSLQSVLEQTYSNLDVIVVDDGSTDSTPEFLASTPSNVRCFRQENHGAAAARNLGLQHVRGELIAFQDSDDVWHPHRLERGIAVLADNPDVGLTCGGARLVDVNGNDLGKGYKPMPSGNVTQELFSDCFITMPTVLVRRSVTDQAGMLDASLKVNEDYTYWLRVSLLTEFASIDEPLVDVRRSANSLSQQNPAENACIALHSLEHFYNELGGRDAICPKVASCRLARLSFVAARAQLRAGCREKARELFARSLSYRPTFRAALGRLRAA